MRLLNTALLELEYFTTKEKPPYAILSHTWGSEEVLYDHARHGPAKLRSCGRTGLFKVLKSAEIALNDGYNYIWVDTCCIDKSSSAELSEAINSMFAWYRESRVCYAFLEDYTHGSSDDELSTSRWFTRGWTLQELIAPLDVQFYDASWTRFGNRLEMSFGLSKITGIDVGVLSATLSMSQPCEVMGVHPDNPQSVQACDDCRERARLFSAIRIDAHSISTKMSWAAHRKTTRVEDIAYCLMGVFNVNMPLLYGEGSAKAFHRLQEEIIRRSNDQTILVWQCEPYRQDNNIKSGVPYWPPSSLLAGHPAHFRSGNLFEPVRKLNGKQRIAISSTGIEVDVHVAPCEIESKGLSPGIHVQEVWLAILNCSHVNDLFVSPALLLRPNKHSARLFSRLWLGHPFEHCQYVIVNEGPVSNTFSTNDDAASIGEELFVRFDHSKLEKRKIILHEPEVTHYFELPKAQFLLTSNLLFPEYQVRRAVALTARLPTYPEDFETEGCLYKKVFYGAASASDGLDAGFFVLWGVWYPANERDLVRLAYTDPDGWRSDKALPFCEVYQHRDRDRDEGLLDEGNLADHHWVGKLVAAVSTGGEAIKDLAPDVTASSVATCRRRVASKTKTEKVQVTANISISEFLGRARFRIQATVEPLNSQEPTSVSSRCMRTSRSGSPVFKINHRSEDSSMET